MKSLKEISIIILILLFLASGFWLSAETGFYTIKQIVDLLLGFFWIFVYAGILIGMGWFFGDFLPDFFKKKKSGKTTKDV